MRKFSMRLRRRGSSHGTGGERAHRQDRQQRRETSHRSNLAFPPCRRRASTVTHGSDIHHPNGHRGGIETCVRPSATRKPIELHSFWDRVITSSSNTTRQRNEATALRNEAEFAKRRLTELGSTDFKSCVKESAEIAAKITYQNGEFFGTPKGSHRRIVLAGYRLAEVLKGITVA